MLQNMPALLDGLEVTPELAEQVRATLHDILDDEKAEE
jgi:hypothetical protein